VRPALHAGLLAVALALTAALFDAEPLWVPALALALLVAGNVAWVTLAARGVSVRRTLSARRVVEDDPVGVVIEVLTSGPALPVATIIDPLLSGSVALPAGRRQHSVRIEARFARRGRRVLAPSRVRISDPLGLVTRELGAAAAQVDDEILVLPRLEPVRSVGSGAAAARISRRGLLGHGAEVELDGIRPLRDGTSAARIFWPSIARGAEPQERHLTADCDSSPLIVLDPRTPADEDALDAAVRAAASLAHALALAGGCALLLPGDRRATELGETLAGWTHVHARLALLGPATAPTLGAVAHRRGPIIFVSARVRGRLPAALGVAAGATRVLVVPGAIAARQAAFTVAGCSGYVLSARRARAIAGAKIGAHGA